VDGFAWRTEAITAGQCKAGTWRYVKYVARMLLDRWRISLHRSLPVMYNNSETDRRTDHRQRDYTAKTEFISYTGCGYIQRTADQSDWRLAMYDQWNMTYEAHISLCMYDRCGCTIPSTASEVTTLRRDGQEYVIIIIVVICSAGSHPCSLLITLQRSCSRLILSR